MTLEATPRLITIGETMMMIAPARAESLATAQDVRLYAGGAESNVACHVAHAGLSSAWVGVVGDDDLAASVGPSNVTASTLGGSRTTRLRPRACTSKPLETACCITAAGRPHPE
jgi:pfkB family carbohydrate kinase.